MNHQHRGWLRILVVVASGLLVAVLAAGSGQAGALPSLMVASTSPAVSGPFLHYQARLLDPVNGQPKPDGPYQMSFKLYGSELGGSPLWTEAKEVLVSNGVFSTLLGDVAPLNLSIFDGRALWLGITVGADAEATPRQPVAYAAYALYARNAGLLNGQQSNAFAAASHQHTGADITAGVVAEPRIDPALARDDEVMPLVQSRDGAGSGLDADMLDGQQATAFAVAGHQHAGADITTGTVAEPRIAPTLARDDEVLPLVLGHDGADSGLDADLLDGQQSNAFAAASHLHAGADITTGTVAEPRIAPTLARDTEVMSIVLGGDGAGSTLDADLLDGQQSNAFAAASHLHAGADITTGTVAEPRIDPTLARDAEVMSIVLGGDGAGSTLDADLLDGQQATAFAVAGHQHPGTDITTGIVAEPRIDPILARDAEVMSLVLGRDGAGSTLDADLLDGQQATAFAVASHPHAGADITTGIVAESYIAPTLTRDDEVLPLILGRDGAGSGLDADNLDGKDATAFASTSHNHFNATWSGNDGQLGLSVSNEGIGDGIRVYGKTSQGNYAAIYARNVGTSPAIDAESTEGYAIKAVGVDHTGVYGETNGDWSWKSGVHGVAKKEHAMGVLGENTANGVGVRGKSESGAAVEGTSVTGVGVRTESRDGTLIEAWDLDPYDLRFYVRNDGWVFADGPYITPAADVAEMLPAEAALEPGDVLVVNLDGKLSRSTAAYQPTVVGVYSTKPGFVGGHDADAKMPGSIPLAVVGVVPVKVTAENGAIAPGDLLVTSSRPGHAMKAGANPPQGTVIGKALTSLDASQHTGVIDMIANLQ